MGVGRACVAFFVATLPVQVAAAVTKPASIPSPSATRPARYSVRLSIIATVTGRKYLFFPFKGMLRAEGNTIFSTDSGNDGAMTLESLSAPNFILVTGGRKASEVFAKSAATGVELGVSEGLERIAEWASEYPEWAEGVKREKRKALPFLVSATPAGQMRFNYEGGFVTSCASTLRVSYAWPSSKAPTLTLFDGLLAGLALFNHSPFPASNGSKPPAVPTAAVPTAAVPTAAVPTAAVPTAAVPTAAVPTAAVPIAPALRNICVTVLPEARSEVEFTETEPIPVEYRCDSVSDPGLVACRGEVSPHARVEKGFVLDTYVRETIRHSGTGALVSDAIAIALSGQKGNSIRVTIEIRRLSEPAP
ncbi:MAG: hypothetical protein HYX75_11735 [Acidobacteria bacterium]|nr:hypothetical protein [Acidobacteriota bacterium]